jgi:hypothetical protein
MGYVGVGEHITKIDLKVCEAGCFGHGNEFRVLGERAWI